MSFYVTGGTLESDAPSYVEREADRQLYQGLLQGEFCYVLTARQMGKSSLMVRTADRLHRAGIHIVALDLTAVGAQNITPEQWYYGLLDTLSLALGLQTELEKFWQNNRNLGPLHCFMKALRQIVLPRLEPSGDIQDPPTETIQDTASVPVQDRDSKQPEASAKANHTKVRLVIFVDEIDFVRSLPFSTDEFFAAIRECYNRRTLDTTYERLTFCLLGVASPSDLIRDTRTTPFNIGRRIELNDFTPQEAASLAQGLRESGVEDRTSKRLLERVLYWTNGHPYLTQRLCLATAERLRAKKGTGSSAAHASPHLVEHLCDDLFFCARARELDDNLIFVRERLLRSEADLADLLELYRNVWRGKRVTEDSRDPLIRLLILSGIVRVDEGLLRERNRIYARVFNGEWARSNLPKAELRRQREAYFRGLVRATVVTTGVFIAMVGLIALAMRARHAAGEATWKSLYRQAQVSRASALPGQRIAALEFIRQASKIKPSPELTDEAIACLALTDVRKQPDRATPEKDATALAFSDDLELYASSTPTGEMVVRRAADDTQIARWKAGATAQERIWISPDKQYVAAAHREDGQAVLTFWRCPSGQKLFALTNHMQLEAFDFRPDSRQIAVGGEDGLVRIFALPGGEAYTDFPVGNSCSVLRYDPGGGRLAVGSSGSLKLSIYEAAGGALVKALHSASPPINLAWHPDGTTLAAACEDRQIRLWETDVDEFAGQELPREAGEITALVFSRNGSILASAYTDQTVRLWSGSRNQPPLKIADCGNTRQLQFDAHDHWLGLAGAGGTLRFMEVATGDVCRTLSEFDSQGINALDIHPKGRLLAAAHSGGITFWDLTMGRKLGRMPAGNTVAARFHPVSGEIIDAEFRGTYCFDVEVKKRADRDLLALKPKEDFYLGPGAVGVDFAAEVDVLAVAYGDRVRLARSTNSAYGAIDELIGKPGFQTIALSPNGRLVAAGNWESDEVWIWDRSTGKILQLPVEGRAQVRFSPHGGRLATGTERKVTLWDTQSWKPSIELPRPSGTSRPAPIAFAKARRLWATVWSDDTVCLFDLEGKVIAHLEAPEKEPLIDLVFTPDGSRLVCATAARTVLIWDLDGLARKLAQLSLNTELKASGVPKANPPPLTLEIGALDRLRFSQPKYIWDNRRDIADITNLIRKNPGKWDYYYNRAIRYERLGEYENAIADYRRLIELDHAAGASVPASRQAWPLRDLARIYLFGPTKLQDYITASNLTHEALGLDPDNPDNHFRYGIACYGLRRYEEATNHLETARSIWQKQRQDKDVAAVLFYQAMCLAHKKDILVADKLLKQAKYTYARTDFESRKSLMDQFPDLLWEAERVVSTARGGG